MKKMISRTLVSCAALAVMGGALIAPSLATERETGNGAQTPQTASATVSTLSATAVSSAAKTDDIGEDAAREAALDQAGLSSSQVRWIFAKRDYEDGRLEYEVTFRSGSWKYDVDVDAATGAVTSYDQDWKGRGNPQSATDIGAEKAKTLALEHAGVKAADALLLKTELDYDDGLRVYEVEFFTDGREYDYQIDAAEGTVLSFDYSIEDDTSAASGSDYLTEAQVKEIVERTAGTTGVYREFKMDTDDGRVLDDIQKSYDLISQEVGPVTFFAYPFGVTEPDAEDLINTLFPVTVVTKNGTADLRKGLHQMPRITVTMNKELDTILD